MQASGHAIATIAGGVVLDTWFPQPTLGALPAVPSELQALVGIDAIRGVSKELVSVEIDLDKPGEGEVLVKITAAGICHSDLSVVNGSRPRPTPLIGGHEGAGIVEEVGPGVKDLKPGDSVAIVFLPSCGECEQCREGVPAFCSVGSAANVKGELIRGGSRISYKGEKIHHYNGVSCYSQYMVLDRRSLIQVPSDLPI